MNAASITSFLDDALAGNLAPTLKSEEPEAGDIGPVTVLKGKSFNELVIDNDNDVYVIKEDCITLYCRCLSIYSSSNISITQQHHTNNNP